MPRLGRRLGLFAIALLAAIGATFMGFSTFAKSSPETGRYEADEASANLGAHSSATGSRVVRPPRVSRVSAGSGSLSELFLPDILPGLATVARNGFWSVPVSESASGALQTSAQLLGTRSHKASAGAIPTGVSAGSGGFGGLPAGPGGFVLPWFPTFDDPPAGDGDSPLLASLVPDDGGAGESGGGGNDVVVTPEPAAPILFAASALLVSHALRTKRRDRKV